jgi:predicted RNase H-like HicB family nuclease
MTQLSVLIETQKENDFLATVLGLPDCQARGRSYQEALDNVQKDIATRLNNAKIVSIEVNSDASENPWIKYAGMFEDDVHFDELLEDIEIDRRALDAERDAYYRQLDQSDSVA